MASKYGVTLMARSSLLPRGLNSTMPGISFFRRSTMAGPLALFSTTFARALGHLPDRVRTAATLSVKVILSLTRSLM